MKNRKYIYYWKLQKSTKKIKNKLFLLTDLITYLLDEVRNKVYDSRIFSNLATKYYETIYTKLISHDFTKLGKEPYFPQIEVGNIINKLKPSQSMRCN